MMSNVSLFDYDYEPIVTAPLTISLNFPLSVLKTMVNNALNRNALTDSLVQKVIDWLKEKELKVLQSVGIGVKDRSLTFKTFTRAFRTLGTCRLFLHNPDFGEICLSKHLKLKDNSDGIINVLAHEVLHGILPYAEGHGALFKRAMSIVNKSLSLQIQLKGVHGKVEVPKVKYEVYCPCCGRVLARYMKAAKVVKHPNRYICPECGDKVKIRKLY